MIAAFSQGLQPGTGPLVDFYCNFVLALLQLYPCVVAPNRARQAIGWLEFSTYPNREVRLEWDFLGDFGVKRKEQDYALNSETREKLLTTSARHNLTRNATR